MNFPHFKPIHYIKIHLLKGELENYLIHKEVYFEPDLNSISLLIYPRQVCGVKRSYLLKVYIRFFLLEVFKNKKQTDYCFPLPVVILIKCMGWSLMCYFKVEN